MPINLLQTKTYLSPPHDNLIFRSRLVDQLSAGLQRPLTLISAPAGTGKTSLVRSWRFSRESANCKAAWLSLDAEDNGIVRFLTYLVAALHQVGVGADSAPAAMLRGRRLPKTGEVLDALINELTELDGDFALFLDDYQVIEDSAVHEAMCYLLAHRPPNMHVVVLSRTNPPLPLERLRAQGDLTEIRFSDLRFTEEEAEEFLRSNVHVVLSPEAKSSLLERTEGWITALQLEALSIQGDPPGATKVGTGTKSGRHLVEYLLSEVLEQQSDDVQRFLLVTSILDRVCAPLCEYLLAGMESALGLAAEDRVDSAHMLNELERRNLFVTPLDRFGHWYRYHQVFRDFLRDRVREVYPDLVPTLHRFASEWYQSRAYPRRLVGEAMQHAVLTGDWAYVAQLGEALFSPMLTDANVQVLSSRTMTFPEKVMVEYPILHLLQISTQEVVSCEDNREIHESWVEKVEQAALAVEEPEHRDRLLGYAALGRAYLNAIPDPNINLRDASALVERAASLLNEADPLQLACEVQMSWCHMASGDVEEAARCLAKARRLARDNHEYVDCGDIVFQEMRLAQEQGRLRAALRIYDQSLQLQNSASRTNGPANGSPDIVYGGILLEQDALQEAETRLVWGLAHDRTSLVSHYEMTGYVSLWKLRQVQHRYSEALTCLETLAATWPDLAFLTDALRVQLLLSVAPEAESTIGAASTFCRSFPPEAWTSLGAPGFGPLGCADAYHLARVAWARAQIALGRPSLAVECLEPQLDFTRQHGLNGRAVSLLVHMSLALHALGCNRRSLDALHAALLIGQSEGFVNTFNEGPVLNELLERVSKHSDVREYANRLLLRFEGPSSGAGNPAQSDPLTLLEPIVSSNDTPTSPATLTNQEMAIMRLVAEGFSNREIARSLYIEIGTVKQHMNHIMRKLEATSRTSALAKARRLNLHV